MQSNLTFDDIERAAYASGHPLPHWLIETAEELEGAKVYMDVATDHQRGQTPDDLKQSLDALNDLYCALPDGVSDADELKAYVSEQEAIGRERDDAIEALETIEQAIRDILKRERGGLNRTRAKELADWLTHATTAREGIDRYRFRQDLDI